MARKRKQDKTLLVDFDIAVFKYSWTHELSIDWLDGTTATRLQTERAMYELTQFLDSLLKRCGCSRMRLFATGSFNFRYAVLPTYKHNRADVVKPQLIEVLRERITEEHELTVVKGLEADDLLGIHATRSPDNTIIATIDKDLKQIPGNLYLWNKDTLETTSLEEADWWFYRQILTGDSTDGYAGCPGIGPKKAEALLLETPREEWWDAILTAYGKKGLTEDDALQQARVARILRNEDYDEENQKPILWRP